MSGPLADPPPMRRIAVLRRMVRADGRPYLITEAGAYNGHRLVVTENDRRPGEWLLLMSTDIEPDRRR